MELILGLKPRSGEMFYHQISRELNAVKFVFESPDHCATEAPVKFQSDTLSWYPTARLQDVTKSEGETFYHFANISPGGAPAIHCHSEWLQVLLKHYSILKGMT